MPVISWLAGIFLQRVLSVWLVLLACLNRHYFVLKYYDMQIILQEKLRVISKPVKY